MNILIWPKKIVFSNVSDIINASTFPLAIAINPFLPNAPFHRKVFWCFQGLEKGRIGNGWIKWSIVLPLELVIICPIITRFRWWFYLEKFSFLSAELFLKNKNYPPNLLLKSCFVWHFGTRKTFQKLIKTITKFFGPFWIQV